MTEFPNALYFFDVPIYRCTLKAHTKLLNGEKERYVNQFSNLALAVPPSRLQLEMRWAQREWYSWRFNEIVGWIRLFVLFGSQLRADWFYAKGRRFLPRGRREFQLLIPAY